MHVKFAHVPRNENRLADWLAGVGIARESNTDLFDLYPPLRPDPTNATVHVPYGAEQQAPSEPWCVECKQGIGQ